MCFKRERIIKQEWKKTPTWNKFFFFFYFFAVRYEVAYQGDIWLGAVIFN